MDSTTHIALVSQVVIVTGLEQKHRKYFWYWIAALLCCLKPLLPKWLLSPNALLSHVKSADAMTKVSNKYTTTLYCASVFCFKWTIRQSVPSGFSCVLPESKTRFAVLECNTDNKCQNIDSSTVSNPIVQKNSCSFVISYLLIVWCLHQQVS